MESSSRFRINSPRVIHEILDGEAVIVNLESGIYYSADNVGAKIWELIGEGRTLQNVVESLLRSHEGQPADIAKSVESFLAQMLAEELIVPEDAAPPASPNGHSLNGDATGSAKDPFAAPTLEKYSDMQEMLLLDPIHEVDETGWPRVKEEPST